MTIEPGKVLGGVASVLVAVEADRLFNAFVLPGVLMVALIIEMSVEMYTCHRSSSPRKKKKYNWDRAISKKLLRIAIIVACMGLDATAFIISTIMPKEWPLIEQGYPITTLSSIIWFIGTEAWKIGQNFASVEGIEELPPAFRTIVGWIKKVDLTRGVPQGGHERWYDELDGMTDQEIIEVFQQAKARLAARKDVQ